MAADGSGAASGATAAAGAPSAAAPPPPPSHPAHLRRAGSSMGGSTTSLTHTRRHTSRIPNLFFDDSETSEDGRKYNPAVMEFIRSDWIAGQMLGRESEFTDYRDVYAMVGTWNVNGKMPEESVASWVASLKAPDGRWPELVVVG